LVSMPPRLAPQDHGLQILCRHGGINSGLSTVNGPYEIVRRLFIDGDLAEVSVSCTNHEDGHSSGVKRDTRMYA
jgi:hypothetical protein